MGSYKNSAILLDRAKQVLAGGVSSEFRKYNHPHAIFYSHGKGSRIYDVDGNEYLDFTLSQGPLILGHSHPHVLKSVAEYSEEGQLYAGQHIREVELAEKLNALIPSAELMRFCLDGSEAVQTAFRVARAKTGRKKFLRFEGHYHGWLDNVAYGISAPNADALGDREQPNVFPWTAGLPDSSRDDFIVLPWNDLELVGRVLEKRHEEIAAIITEPIMCNNGCILPKEGFLSGLRELCNKYGVTLIFDEVITGFRVGLGGAQSYYGVTPDLSIFAKAMGSGYPISAIVGKREWMELVAAGKVIHAGTMNAGNPTVAAALATIEVLEQEMPYDRMHRLGRKLMQGLQRTAAEAAQDLSVQGLGPMFVTYFGVSQPLSDYRDTLGTNKAKLGRFVAGLHDAGVRVIGRGLWYISAAHTEAEINQAIEVASRVLHDMNSA
ncbi:glutamate-1-semialdehyde 2,1-aminomutase [Parapedobacter defluvii]|uniref:Glutamate-1-semialdehyde 2,1-aminomutase n=1 Tax=Parapedobacter defluvii TaxID=2045106 RepID=A0ABQ1KZ00_9SPHI|nr:aspartate aminotransferase family protein [Parapedobacter defluvii]GGC15514.1 glutamate-1-semialdehyde 2,1-aminomutase [Parapedobacter defluvii]